MSNGARGGMRGLVMRAAGWSMIAYIAGNVVRIASSLILTRLLVPEMFGVMAVVWVVQMVVSLFSDVGLRQSVVQNARGEEQSFLNTAWTLQAIRGGIIWLICLAIALAIGFGAGAGWLPAGSAYAAPELPALIVAVALTALIQGFNSTKMMTADRQLNLKRVSIIELVAQIVGLIAAIAAAWATRSIWSFVFAALVSALITLALSHAYLPGPRNRLRLERAAALDMLRFGRWILVSSAFYVLATNGDRMLLGGWVDPATLGLYALAFNLVWMVDVGGGRLFINVAMPALSKVVRERPETMRSAYYKLRLPFDAIYIVCAGLLYGGGGAIIDFMYDARYAQASTMLEILSFSLLISRFGLAQALYLAYGQPRYQGVINFVKMVSLFTVTPLAHWAFGFEGALWAIALHGVATLALIFHYNRRYGLNNLIYEAAVLLFWPIGYGAGMIFTALLAHASWLTLW